MISQSQIQVVGDSKTSENPVVIAKFTTDNSKVAFADSKGLLTITDVSNLKSLSNWAIEDSICNFSLSHNMIWIASKGGVKCFDLRSTMKHQVTEVNFDHPLLSIDVNKDGSLLCCGTDLLETKKEKSNDDNDDPLAEIFVTDLRHPGDLLMTLCDSHSDAVNCLKFWQENGNFIASGGADGLVNIFDLKESTEDDALQLSINAESSLLSVNWFGSSQPSKSETVPLLANVPLAATTDDNRLRVWRDGDVLCKFDADTYANSSDTYANSSDFALVNAIWNGSSAYSIATAPNGEIWTSQIHLDKMKKLNYSKARYEGYKEGEIGCKEAIRTVDFCAANNLLVTGHDDGMVFVHKVRFEEETTKKSSVSAKSRKRNKPY